MSKIFIDGKAYHAEEGQTIIQIADGINCGKEEQVDIPRFCYHEELSVAGNCRMCLVEFGFPKLNKETKEQVLDENGEVVIQWMPKLTTACSTEIADQMRVKTHHSSKLVKDAQKGILEFILINHPLDCPTCDQAGECPLQKTTYKYGPEGSRYEFEKVRKPKREKWGNKITFDAERCINCTRCVRFFDEYTQTSELEIVQRGWNNYPAPSPNANFDENPYAMNVIELCPVGALTNTDYRFKSRVWEMSATDTISVNDARGSSITLWVRNNLIMRVTPRYNPLVNGYFISDEDRLNYKWINENRVSTPKVKSKKGMQDTTWTKALVKAADILKMFKPEEIFVLASSKSSLESLYALKKFNNDVLETTNVDFIRHEKGANDDKLIRSDKTPNKLSCEILEIGLGSEVTVSNLSEAIVRGKIKCVLAVEDDISKIVSLNVLKKLSGFIAMPYHNTESNSEADVVLPAATFAEILGVYLNFEGVAQLAKPAKVLRYQNRELIRSMVVSRLDKHATMYDKWFSNENKVDALPTWEILSKLSEIHGSDLNYQSSKQILEEITKVYDLLQDISYESIGNVGVKLNLERQEI